MASTYLTRTQTTGNQKIFTVSAWVKRTGISAGNQIMSFEKVSASNARGEMNMKSDNRFSFNFNPTGSAWHEYNTVAVFRDPSNWYHICCKVDTTQATDTDRLKIFINGVSVAFTGTLPTLNFDTGWNEDGNIHAIGRYQNGADAYFDGLMSHVYFIDGTAYDADTFGSTDATSGEWVINTSPSVTYGTNGFLILKDGNTITDQGSNSNDFTLGGGTLTDLQDCPSDVFATFNPLVKESLTHNATYSNGNTTIDFPNGGDGIFFSTLGAYKGKFYSEFKLNAFSDNSHYVGVSSTGIGWFGGTVALKYSKSGNTNKISKDNVDVQTGLTSLSAGDIVGIAVDIDNQTVDFTVNGSAYGTQVTGCTFFTGNPIMFFCSGEGHASAGRTFNLSANFGNGYFSTTAITSEGTNASGIGKFEYDVPTGYTALSLKGLQE